MQGQASTKFEQYISHIRSNGSTPSLAWAEYEAYLRKRARSGDLSPAQRQQLADFDFVFDKKEFSSREVVPTTGKPQVGLLSRVAWFFSVGGTIETLPVQRDKRGGEQCVAHSPS